MNYPTFLYTVVCNHRKLESVSRQLNEIRAENATLKYMNTENGAAQISGIVNDISYAFQEYQVSFSWLKLALKTYAI